MKKEIRLYNVIFPIWLIIFLPTWLWLIIIPGNLVIDLLVSFLALRSVGCARPRDVLEKVWWKIWLLGFLADFIGGVFMLLGMIGPGVLDGYQGDFSKLWENTVSQLSHNSFAHPAAFLWTLAAVALAGVCIYFFDKRAMKNCGLEPRQLHFTALSMAVVTAPWLFFVPIY